MKVRNIIHMACLAALLAACTSQKENPVDFIDPFIGTGFHGHTYPGATVPFGAVQLSPDTRAGNWDACAGYHYDDSTLTGFSHTHLSGTGCIDLGDLLIRPTTQTVDPSRQPMYAPAAFRHENEKAEAGYYAVLLHEEGIRAELTATAHTGVHRYTFPKESTPTVIVDLKHSLDNEHIYESSLQVVNPHEMTGMRNTRGWSDNQRIYFVIQCSQPFEKATLVSNQKALEGKEAEGTDLQALLKFKDHTSEPIVMKVGLSIVSVENARENLQAEVEGFDFDAVKQAAYHTWNDAVSAIKVEGGTEEQKTNFYTALYHSMVVPNVVSDVNGQYRRHDQTIGQLPQGAVQYSTFSLWDTFRAWNPMMTLIDTTLVTNMIHSFLHIYDASGELPLWPLSAGETGTMIGYHSASVIADAYMKGIRGFDAEKALEALVVSSEKNQKGADYYISKGFIPSNIKKESISCLLEFAYDDWCIAQLAQALGKQEIYDTYIRRSQQYLNVFDGATRFFRPKRMDGNWETPFNPNEVGRAYTEATAWQYRFFVPHDVNGMVQLFGGKEAFTSALDDIFHTDAQVDGDLVDITGLIGQYAHGNEPSHHIAYLYNYIGQPWKTQAMTRRLLDEMYAPTPEGIVGNEDCGQMSAWYILSSLGLYAVCPGSNEFTFTTPLFEKATLQLANSKTLTITANHPEKNLYIDKVELNGKEIETNFVTYEQLMGGGELHFSLTDQPNRKRGVTADSAPYSFTKEAVVSIPYVDKDLNLFMDSVTVNLATATVGATVHYTLDGSEPTQQSPVFNAPLVLKNTTQINAKAFKDGFQPSSTLSIQATKAVLNRGKIILDHQPKNGTAYKYYEGHFQKVADMQQKHFVEKGIVSEPSLDKARQEDHYGFEFSGLIDVPEDGVYTFQTRSDDGSVLYIDQTLVVDNDGSHAAIPATGSIALKKGWHSYRLLYIEDYEGQHLSWAWELPSGEKLEPIPASRLYVY
ncbi:GH92 family glycosyl hydrolase [uncultured Bacteroides sp.]|jgi:predicted alpha-1,2-mannosidase|uniref:GH92 family glycosyl hydrolase n=1 Tax=uncultured Bacteroides sp. TaxID=162156 RepID=UPI0025E7867F|nr:GH92 family glycosyl hydrolase [uncultured Bacteroides sp.]